MINTEDFCEEFSTKYQEKEGPESYPELELSLKCSEDDPNKALLILNPIHPAGQNLFKIFKKSIKS